MHVGSSSSMAKPSEDMPTLASMAYGAAARRFKDHVYGTFIEDHAGVTLARAYNFTPAEPAT